MVSMTGRRRSPWIWIGVLVAALLVAGGLWSAAPRITASSPADGLTRAANDTVISVTFNRPMDPASVQDHFSVRPAVPGRFVWQGDQMRFEPTSTWPSGVQVKITLSPGARSRLFLPLVSGRTWTFQVGAPELIYAAPSQAGAQLFGSNLGEGQGDKLTSAARGVMDYGVAGDAGDVFYLTASSDGGQAVDRLDVRSGSDSFLLACPTKGCRRVQASPDGAWLALEAQSGPQGSPTGPGEVWVAPTDGSRSPIRLGEPSHDLKNSLWSPDGKLAVFDASQGMMVVFGGPPDFALAAEIPNKLGEMGAWSPDGRYLTYPEIVFVNPTAAPGGSTSGEAEYYSHLFRYEIQTGLVADLSGQGSGLIEDASPAYSPDGLWIAFARKSLEPARWTLGRQLWLMHADGSQARPLTSQPVLNFSTFAWRPDSKVLVFVQSDQADPSQPPGLGWLDVATGQTHPLLKGGYAPAWIP